MSMSNVLRIWIVASSVFLLCATIASRAQTVKSIVSFDYTDGEFPFIGSLVQGTNGKLYGVALQGGANNWGTVFEVTGTGNLATLYSFCSLANCADGLEPQAEMVQTHNGNLYGTTSGGGANGYGTVFDVTGTGKLTTLYSFCSLANCADGANPEGGLLQATNGDLYGTTFVGGSSCGCGTVFRLTPTGKLITYSFGGGAGNYPIGGLIQATDGNIYGTAQVGGAFGGGTVFKMTLAGTLTAFYNFCSQFNGTTCLDGASPYGGVVQATDGYFYGTTFGSGAYDAGTVFEISPAGTLTTLHTFCSQSNCTDGSGPVGGVVQATDGNVYGTTEGGGAYNAGTIFEVITSTGEFSTLYSFCSQSGCPDGQYPEAGLMQDTNGTIFGTTYVGGTNCILPGCGSVFSLSVGIGPFVETNPTSGKVGTKVTILGNNLAGATSVTFNGTTATFKALNTYITTTVPIGATTGSVEVVTPKKTLKSNLSFQVP
jgi:uncharacterized repeat protein (TIGR03803 family)